MGCNETNYASGWQQLSLHTMRMLLILTFTTILLGGCARVDSRSNSSSNQNAGAEIAAALETPGTTPATTPNSTPTLLPRERSATQIARFNDEQATVSAHSTSFALGTPYPTSRPFTPLPTSPVMTPVPGINGDCANADREFSFVNCWNAVIGGEYMFADTVVLKADPLQAVLHVYTATLDLRDMGPMESYPTSIRVGMVRISSVNWPLMTLTTLQANPPTTFAFDLSTRQWVSPPSTATPGPSPSVLVSPVPSVSPLPTQSP
jgi:uncharacterized protein YceK